MGRQDFSGRNIPRFWDRRTENRYKMMGIIFCEGLLPVNCHGLERGRITLKQDSGRVDDIAPLTLRIGPVSQLGLKKTYFEGKGGFERVRVGLLSDQ
jgi:hypothetical protein